MPETSVNKESLRRRPPLRGLLLFFADHRPALQVRHRSGFFKLILLCLALLTVRAGAGVQLPSVTTPEGYVCRLIINEVPFPGEKGYRSEEDTKAAMEQLLFVLDSRLKNIPNPYLQEHIATTRTDDILDIITAGGVRGQFDGFYRDNSGQPVMVPRVTERIDNLVQIAGRGEPGRFARLLEYAATLSSHYMMNDVSVADRFASLHAVDSVPATGHAFSWMTDEVRFHPGGNYLRIPDSSQGSLGGNRFFTLRKEPK